MLRTSIYYVICFSIILSLFVYSQSKITKSMELSFTQINSDKNIHERIKDLEQHLDSLEPPDLIKVSSQGIANIELLDIEKNKIITIPTNPKTQLEAEKIIKEIDNVVIKFNPFPDKGYMLKIPLTPSLRLENKWINAVIAEVIFIFPEDEVPYLLLFDDENKPYFFTFKTEIDPLLKTLDFPL
ncbi:hypothetical protein [Sporosarcina koreensis]|uniref:Uncharacterized protein n=1 Tax=Sporosarcina koreensis TaxID=334735 RepID=A0ABW0TW26_9BACL